jgi:hypothetical protein
MHFIQSIKRILCCLLVIVVAGCFLSPSEPAKTVNNPPTTTGLNVDSLFSLLIARIQNMDNINSYDEFAATDFKSLQAGFSAAATKTPDNVKANVGLMVSSLLSLNKSQRIGMLADSIDSYSHAMDSLNSNEATVLNKRLMRKALQKEGVIGLGKALAAKTPSLARVQTAKPSFPKFLTLEYIQKVAEEEIVPALDTIVRAAERLEGLADVALPLIIESEGERDTFELDKGEVYVTDALCRLARAFIGFYCTYDFDLYTPQTNDYRWIDSMVNSASGDSQIISLSGDTLYHLYKYDDAKPQIQLANMFKYNLSRPGFMTIRKQNHAKVKADLIAVTERVKSGVGYIRNESDNQDNDIIKMTQISEADGNLVDLKTEMLDDGVSPALANKFSSPETIADFVKELLSGPYTFDETVEKNVHISMRVNMASWFDNPVTDLRTLLPKYKWTSENTWRVTKQSSQYIYSNFMSDSSFTVYDDGMPVSLRIPQANVIRTTANTWGGTTYYLNRPIRYEATIDSSIYLDPLRLADAGGIEISPEQIDLQIDQKTFFPYFDDYTFHGLFPDMTTRQAWITMIYQ